MLSRALHMTTIQWTWTMDSDTDTDTDMNIDSKQLPSHSQLEDLAKHVIISSFVSNSNSYSKKKLGGIRQLSSSCTFLNDDGIK